MTGPLDGTTMFARQFIDHRAPGFHRAFSVPSYFNESTSSYEPTEINNLRETLHRHQTLNPQLADFPFDLTSCSWDDVIGELKRVETAMSANEDRGKKFPKRLWRGLGATASAISPGLVGIPDKLSVLHGGLALIFSMARHREQDRLKILRAFEDIPKIMCMARSKAKNFPLDHDQPDIIELHASIRQLQDTLLKTLPDLIDRLNPGTFLAKAKSPFRSFNIDTLLDTIRSSADKVQVCANALTDDVNTSMYKTLTENYEATQEVRIVARTTNGHVEDLRNQVEEVLRGQRSLQATLDMISGKNGLFQFLLEHLKLQGEIPTNDAQDQTYASSSDTAAVRPSELLALLNVHHLASVQDEDLVLRRGRSLDSAAIGQAAIMIKTQQVQRLLHEPRSGIVLVEACGDRAQLTRTPPISYVCASLAQALRRGFSNTALVFFCGQHISLDDNLRGPQGLMRSLLAQLILVLGQNNWLFDHCHLSLPCRLPNEVESIPLQDVCKLFCQLLQLVPRGSSVFCLVDGISYYERGEWDMEHETVIGTFDRIVADRALGGFFKLLMTSPTKSERFLDLQPHQRVALRSVSGRVGVSSNAEFRRAGLGLDRRYTS